MAEDSLERIAEKVEQILAILRLANADRLEMLKKEIDADPVALAILERTDLGLSAGELVAQVMTVVSQKERTIQARLAELAQRGVLRINRAGKNVYYVRTGLV